MAAGLRLDGTADGFSIPDHADWDIAFPTDDLSISMWLRRHPNDDDGSYIISRENTFGLKFREDGKGLNFLLGLDASPSIAHFKTDKVIKGLKTHIALTLSCPASVDGDGAKVDDTGTASHLKDADGTDWTTVAEVGDTAYNATDGTFATITNVTAHDITLDADIFDVGEVYYIFSGTFYLTVKLYINGELVGTEQFEEVDYPAANANLIYVGSRINSDSFLQADINELLMTSDVLSATEVTYLYNDGTEQTSLGTIDNSIGHWHVDEGSGSSLDEDGGTAAKDGTVISSAPWVTDIDYPELVNGMYKLDNVGDYIMERQLVTTFRWVKPTTAGDDIVLDDLDGNEVYLRTCSVQYEDIVEHVTKWYDSIVLDTIDSGTLYVEVA